MSNLPSQEPNSLEDFFGPPISVYTDKDALEDGTLVDIEQFTRVYFLDLPVHRMTRHLFDELKPFLENSPEGFAGALGNVLRTKCRFARGSSDNTGEVGDIMRIPPNLWLVRNEVGGWTAMYPEDY